MCIIELSGLCKDEEVKVYPMMS